jgi:hypothetical protein
MLIERLDRTAWKLEQAHEHIARQVVVAGLPPASEPPVQVAPWRHDASPQERAGVEAHQELLIALRDGDLPCHRAPFDPAPCSLAHGTRGVAPALGASQPHRTGTVAWRRDELARR